MGKKKDRRPGRKKKITGGEGKKGNWGDWVDPRKKWRVNKFGQGREFLGVKISKTKKKEFLKSLVITPWP